MENLPPGSLGNRISRERPRATDLQFSMLAELGLADADILGPTAHPAKPNARAERRRHQPFHECWPSCLSGATFTFWPFSRDIGGINDDAVLQADSAQNFQRRAIVAANCDRPQLHFVVRSHDRNLRALLAKEHGIDRHRNFLRR